MPIRLERWMRSKLSAITALTPSNMVPLAAQSRELPVPYSLPARITKEVPAALGARQQQIAQADIGERATHHHFVIAAARAVRIEVHRLHALGHQVLGGR